MNDRIPRGFELALSGTAALWAIAASVIAQRSAHGLTGRFNLGGAQELLASLFLIFLLVFGFQLLDWIATRRGEMREIFPLPLRSRWPGEWGTGAAVGWGACLVAVLPLLLTGNLHGHLVRGRYPLAALFLGALTLLGISLAEELIFRGYIFRRLAAALGPSWAAIVTSLLFAVVLVWTRTPDSLFLGVLDGALFGLLLAMAYLRTQALWISWGLHFAWRAVMLLVLGLPTAGHSPYASVLDVFATGPAWLTGGIFGLDAVLPTALVLLVAMAVLYRATRDYAWRYTAPALVSAGYEVAVAPPQAHVAMEQQAAKAAPLVQILSTTSQSISAAPPPRPPGTLPD